MTVRLRCWLSAATGLAMGAVGLWNDPGLFGNGPQAPQTVLFVLGTLVFGFVGGGALFIRAMWRPGRMGQSGFGMQARQRRGGGPFGPVAMGLTGIGRDGRVRP